MRKSQEKELFSKITTYVSKVLDEMIESKQWTATEIAASLQIHNSRITNYRACTRVIPKSTFIKMLHRGIITMDDIKKNVELTDDELIYLSENFGLANDVAASKAYILLKKAGVDPVKIMMDHLSKLNHKTKIKNIK